MKKVTEIIMKIGFTVVLVMLMTFCVAGTALSQSKGSSAADRQYYRAAEKEYVKELRKLLEEKGYENCGVTMNYVTGEDEARTYTVLLHHKKMEKLDENGKEALLEECREIRFPAENCNFCHSFLETDL